MMTRDEIRSMAAVVADLSGDDVDDWTETDHYLDGFENALHWAAGTAPLPDEIQQLIDRKTRR